MLGVEDIFAGGDHRVGKLVTDEILAAPPPGPQHVQALPRHHGGEPAAQVVGLLGLLTAEPQPCVLHRVVGLGERPEHAVRD